MDWLEVAALTELVLEDVSLRHMVREITQGLRQLADASEIATANSHVILANANVHLEDFKENCRQWKVVSNCNSSSNADIRSLLPAILATKREPREALRFVPSEHSTVDSIAGSPYSKHSLRGSSSKLSSLDEKDDSPFADQESVTTSYPSPVKKQSKQEVQQVKVYADGVFDLMHSGHFNALRQAAQLGSELHIGVVSDDEVLQAKGVHPIFTCEERAEIIEACKWVTRVIPNAPYDVSMEFFRTTGCDVVAHGDDMALNGDGQDSYREVRNAGLLKIFKRTSGISSTSLVARLLAVTLPSVVTPRARSEKIDISLSTASSDIATATCQCFPGCNVKRSKHCDDCTRPNQCWSVSTPDSHVESSSNPPHPCHQCSQARALLGVGTESPNGDVVRSGPPSSNAHEIGVHEECGEDCQSPCNSQTLYSDVPHDHCKRPTEIRGMCTESIEASFGSGAGEFYSGANDWCLQHHFPRTHIQLPKSGANVSSKRLLKFMEPCRNREENDTVVYCDGSFDILHNGHVRLFKYAKEKVGGFLIVGVYDDETVRALKGPGYPVQSLRERILCVLAMKYVDEVIIGAPIEINDLLVQSYGIHRIVRGKTIDAREELLGTRKHVVSSYLSCSMKPHLKKMITYFDSQSALTTSTVINRIIGNREKLRQALGKRAAREELYYRAAAQQSDAVREVLD